MKPEEEFLGEDGSDFVFILALAHVQKKHLKAKAVREPAEGKSLLLSCVINSCKWQELDFATHMPRTAPGSQPTPGHRAAARGSAAGRAGRCCPALLLPCCTPAARLRGWPAFFPPCPGPELLLPSQGSERRGWDPARQSICSA